MDKLEKRRLKLAAQQARLAQAPADNIHSIPPVPVVSSLDIINCACVIHGNVYSWDYVTRLHNMLSRHISVDFKLHVYTEANRPVPSNMIRHVLPEWHIGGPKKSWWYKLQIFNADHYQGPLLYFDLDTVITQNIDWIWQNDLHYFWTVRDFKYLWRSASVTANTSIMWFDTVKFSYVYTDFLDRGINQIMRRHQGDQDYVSEVITQPQRRFLDQERIKSWRWQALDGGFDFTRRTYLNPGSGTQLDKNTSVLIFHGKPKPAEIQDPVVLQHWQ